MNKALSITGMTLAFLLFCATAQAQSDCLFPDSQRGDAPAWLCERPVAGWQYLGQGDKSHMPSISLQNRLAGKQAMRAVANTLVAQANTELAQLAGRTLPAMEVKDYLALLSELQAVKIIEKRSSPRRHLYVLAGVAENEADLALHQTMQYLLKQYRKPLQKQLGKTAFDQLQEAVQRLVAESEPTEEVTDE